MLAEETTHFVRSRRMIHGRNRRVLVLRHHDDRISGRFVFVREPRWTALFMPEAVTVRLRTWSSLGEMFPDMDVFTRALTRDHWRIELERLGTMGLFRGPIPGYDDRDEVFHLLDFFDSFAKETACTSP